MTIENEDLILDELRTTRRTLAVLNNQIARHGEMNAPVHMILERQDAEKRIAQLEKMLGIEQPQQPVHQPASRPVVKPTSQPDFNRYIEDSKIEARRSDIRHQLNLLNIHRATLAHWIAQAKAYGGIELAPPITRNGMNEARRNIVQVKRALDQLGGSYDNLPGDE